MGWKRWVTPKENDEIETTHTKLLALYIGNYLVVLAHFLVTSANMCAFIHKGTFVILSSKK